MALKRIHETFYFLTLVLVFFGELTADTYAIDNENLDQEKPSIVSQELPTGHNNPFQLGDWSIPLFITNLLLLVVGILHHKKLMPAILQKSIKTIFDFEVSPKITLIVVIGLLLVYVSLSYNEIENSREESWSDYVGIKAAAESPIIDIINSGNAVKYFLLAVSLQFLGNIRILPFVASIFLVILTYYTTVKISEKRFAGIVAIVILLQSHLFLEYDTTATYENFWTLFYLLSLYTIYKKWYFSPPSFLVSIFSKPLTTLFFPMTFLFIHNSDISRKHKIQCAIVYLLVIVLAITSFLLKNQFLFFENVSFNYNIFLTGFTALESFLRFDGFIILFILPLTVGLFIASRKGIPQAESIMVLIAGILLSAPLLAGFTVYTNQPYRFVPLAVFFAIGVGTLLSKKIGEPIQKEKRFFSYVVFFISLMIISVSITLVFFPDLIERHYRLIV